MKYKSKWYQIFNPKLKVPQYIEKKVFTNQLTINEYINYELYGKVPLTCLLQRDRKILDKFGLEKMISLDWEIINTQLDPRIKIDYMSLLEKIPANEENINETIYEVLIELIPPYHYSSKMKEKYNDRYFEIEEQKKYENIEEYEIKRMKQKFNEGILSIEDIIIHWDIFKDKKFSLHARNDYHNSVGLTEDEIRNFMKNNSELARLISKYDDIYKFIYEYNLINEENKKRDLIRRYTDSLLKKSLSTNSLISDKLKFTNEDYKTIFKYSSLEEELVKCGDYYGQLLSVELKDLSPDYIFNTGIPFELFQNSKVLEFIAVYGLQNIVEFDNECGHFFTKNNYLMLKNMYELYMHYATYSNDEYAFYISNGKKENGVYTKEAFYEIIRRMLLNGPTNREYKKSAPNYEGITGEFRKKYPGLFIDDNAPEELKKLFYSRQLDRNIFVDHPEYKQYFENLDLEIICKPILIWSHQEDGRKIQVSFIEEIKNKYGKEAIDIILYYGEFIEKMSYEGEIEKFNHKHDSTRKELQDELDRIVYDLITEGKTKYTAFMSREFKNKYPYMFLNENVDKEIQRKFYERKFTPDDFIENEELIEIFGNTNIICGMGMEYAWMIPLMSNDENQKEINKNRLKVINSCKDIKDVKLQEAFKEYVNTYSGEINMEKLEYISKVLHRLSVSNSNEMIAFRKELAFQILRTDNPIETLNKVENIFVKNNIPTVGKIYSCFETLHPNFEGFDFSETSSISPVLKNSSTNAKKIIVFSDLIKASFGSNNRSIINYLNNLEYGNKLYEDIMSNKFKYEQLDEKSKKELDIFKKHIRTMYETSDLRKRDINGFIDTNDVIRDITELKRLLAPSDNIDYNLADRMVNMFCHFAGIETLEEAKKYMEDRIEKAEQRNIETSKKNMVLEEGDFIKGIPGGILYLGSILQNGSVSKEYLGASATSDFTPLDTDISRIMSSEGTNKDKIFKTEASGYGDIYFVLKGDDRFLTTRDETGERDVRRDKDKLEVFKTGVVGEGHYGIRTGFSSSDINYIVVANYDERVALEIVKNGFYIPIANKEGKIIFTHEDYKKLQSKMDGLSHYNEREYNFSPNLRDSTIEEIASKLEESNLEINEKKRKINYLITEALKEVNLELKTTIDGDLSEGSVELIDTGSTGRGTNKPGDGDFDFIMRVDKKIISNQEKLNELKSSILRKFNKTGSGETIANGDFRLKGVNIDSQTNVDIDISFVGKTDQLTYSTDMCLQDRLQTIYKQDPEKYKYVVANILLAKQILKEANVYKPHRSDSSQGGLGGVGIENWILQNGGSFIDASRGFVEASNGKTWEEFKETYKIWDFGENHFAIRNGKYPYDNFVYENMSESGYKKMVSALKEYIKQYEKEGQNIRRR